MPSVWGVSCPDIMSCMMTLRKSLPLLLAGLLAVAALSAQQERQSQDVQDQGYRIGVRVDQVFLSVSARSVGGGFLGGLTREDFRIYEDGVEQAIVNFSSDSVPVHVALLIDASGSTRYSQANIQQAAYRFAESLGPEDRVAIITFSDKARLILDWTNDLERIDERLKSIWAKGQTVLNDAVYVTYDDLFQDLSGKKAIILLTDGVDVGSLVSHQEVLHLAERSEASAYVVSLLNDYRQGAAKDRQEYRARLMPVPRPLQEDYINESARFLQRLTRNTGGSLFDAASSFYLTEIYEKVAEEIKNQYYLSYVPTNPRKEGRWRKVEIEATRRADLLLRTRPGYYEDGAVPNTDGR